MATNALTAPAPTSSTTSSPVDWFTGPGTFDPVMHDVSGLSAAQLAHLASRTADGAFTRTETDTAVELVLDRTRAGCRLRVNEMFADLSVKMQFWIVALPFFPAVDPNGYDPVARNVWERVVTEIEAAAVVNTEAWATYPALPPDAADAASTLRYRLSVPTCATCLNESVDAFWGTVDTEFAVSVGVDACHIGYVTAVLDDVEELRSSHPGLAGTRSFDDIVAAGIESFYQFSPWLMGHTSMLLQMGADQLWTTVRVVLPRTRGHATRQDMSFIEATSVHVPPATFGSAASLRVGDVDVYAPSYEPTNYGYFYEPLPLVALAAVVDPASVAGSPLLPAGASLRRVEATWVVADEARTSVLTSLAVTPDEEWTAENITYVMTMPDVLPELLDWCSQANLDLGEHARTCADGVIRAQWEFVSTLSAPELKTLLAVTGLADRESLRAAFLDMLKLASVTDGVAVDNSFWSYLKLAGALL